MNLKILAQSLCVAAFCVNNAIAEKISDHDISLLEQAGYFVVPAASGYAVMPSGEKVLRVFQDRGGDKAAIVSVDHDQVRLIEKDRMPGDTIEIKFFDMDNSGSFDISISELFEIGGGSSYWAVRVYLQNEEYDQAYDGKSSLKPLFLNLLQDESLEMVLQHDRYRTSIDSTFCSEIYKLEDGRYVFVKP